MVKQSLPQAMMLWAQSITRKAAIACYDTIGRGKEKEADMAAVNAMRLAFDDIDIDGTVVIGEGERDKAPMLYIGERLGRGGLPVDIAVDPLEGTTICAKAMPGAMCTLALGPRNSLLQAPDLYMEKIVVGGNVPKGAIDLDNSVSSNLENLAHYKKCNIKDLHVIVLERERHQDLIAQIRKAGATIELIGDGDIVASIRVALGQDADMYIGTGGAPEGVIASAAINCLHAKAMMQCRLIDSGERAQKKYTNREIATSDTIFVATGVTSGKMLDGIKKKSGYDNIFQTHSLVMHQSTSCIMNITDESPG